MNPSLPIPLVRRLFAIGLALALCLAQHAALAHWLAHAVEQRVTAGQHQGLDQQSPQQSDEFCLACLSYGDLVAMAASSHPPPDVATPATASLVQSDYACPKSAGPHPQARAPPPLN